jgi:polysaccharide pyruvyl transferase WcaK-like protein
MRTTKQCKTLTFIDAFHSFVSLGHRIIRIVEFLIALIFALFCRFIYGDAITVYGFYGGINHVNLGDEAICNAMLLRLKQLGHPIWLINTEGRRDYAGVDRVFGSNHMNYHWIQWIKVIRGTRVLVLGGGGLFQDYGSSQGIPMGLAMIQMLFWIAGRPCVWYSIGVGPLTTVQGRFFTRIAAILSSRLTVRDSQSAKLLKTSFSIHNTVKVTTDAAWDLPIREMISFPKVHQHPIITIGMSGFGFYNIVYYDKKHNNRLVYSYSDLIATCLSRGYKVKLLCMDNKQDWSFWSEVRAIVPSHGKQLEIIRTINLSDMLHTMSTLDVLLTMRFHSVILGAMMGVPLGIIAYHPKVQSLTKSMQHEQYTLSLSDVSGSKLVMLLDNVLDKRQTLSAAELSWASSQQELLVINSLAVEDAYTAVR